MTQLFDSFSLNTFYRSLGKKLSGLLHTDDDDWADFGLSKGNHQDQERRSRSRTKSPLEQDPDLFEKVPEEDEAENRVEDEEVNESVGPLERWTSSNSIRNNHQSNVNSDNKEPVRRKSSEMSITMKSRLEAFEREKQQQQMEDRRSTEPEPDKQFGEKLKNFQKISSQSDLKQKELAKGPTKPPPPLSYSQLIDVSVISSLSLSN